MNTEDIALLLLLCELAISGGDNPFGLNADTIERLWDLHAKLQRERNSRMN